uniref:Uncharacterized protein n=1 Tax=Arundo donax TaxID=35708 RepID=A0A0A9EYB8_ARUDO
MGSCSCCLPSHEGCHYGLSHCAHHYPWVAGSPNPGGCNSLDSYFHQVLGCAPFLLQVARQSAWGSCCT